ncbi:MAG: translation initiation factor IF-2 N-terminal domain-containing protein, partial [Myxococcota bacterium]|nr:translation initiation factor IF-2 N-terminal domain-containing protein [Myxococcota bacterium]
VMVADRCRDLGFDVDNHLAQLSSEQVVELTQALSDAASGKNLQEKRVRKTVIRRRRRAEPEPVVEAAPEVEAAPSEASETESAKAETPAAPAAEPVEAASADAAAPSQGDAPSDTEAVSPDAESGAEAEEAAAVAEEATGETAEAAKDEERRPANPYAGAEPVNTPGAAAPETENRESYVQVLGTIDPALAQNLRRATNERPARSAPPTGRPGSGPPNRPMNADPMSIPLPDRGRRGAPGGGEGDRGRKKRKGGRVAYDRTKDRAFDGQMRTRGRRGAKRKKIGASTEITVPKASKRIVKLEDTITVGELAQQLSVKANEIIKYLMGMGEMVTVNHVIDLDTVTLIAQEYDFTVENVA